jgi:uncharacterized protein (UPF0262 family)
MNGVTSDVHALVDDDAVEYLAHTLEKFAYAVLTDEERSAAYQLASLLPYNATVQDFMAACTEGGAAKSNASTELIERLRPLAGQLEQSICYAGRFASLFKQ